MRLPLREEWRGPQFAFGTTGAWGHAPGQATVVLFPFVAFLVLVTGSMVAVGW